MTSSWKDIEVESSGDTSEPATLGALFASLRRLAAKGHVHEALEEAMSAVQGLLDAGLFAEALEVLRESRTFLTEDAVPADRWPWLLNLEGNTLSRLGRFLDAEDAYCRMEQAAVGLDDAEVEADITSTAQQNRGLMALDTDDPEQASELLRQALSQKVELKDWESGVDVLNGLALAKSAVGDFVGAEEALKDAERIARILRDRRRLGAVHGNRGVLRVEQGRPADAEQDFREALKYARRDGDSYRELLSILNLASSLADQGRYGEALRWDRRGARWASESGIATAEVALRRGAALMLMRTSRDREALVEVARATELSERIPHPRLAAECRADLGALLWRLDERKAARESLIEARVRFADLGDSRWEAAVVEGLAEVAVAEESLAAADKLWADAVDLLAGDPQAAADIARHAAEAWIAQGDDQAADRWIERELLLAQEVDEPSGFAWRTATAGALLNSTRTTVRGIGYLERAVDLFESLGQQSDHIRVRVQLAGHRAETGQVAGAIDELRECLHSEAVNQNRVLRQLVLVNLGELLRRDGQQDEAIEASRAAVKLARELDDGEALAFSLGTLGLAEGDAGNPQEAKHAYEEQLELASALRQDEELATALSGLATADYEVGEFSRASERYARAADLRAGTGGVHEVESLGGWLESLAASGRVDKIEPAAQRLVDAAQANAELETGVTALGRTARVLSNTGHRELAFDCYSTALRLAISGLAEATDPAQEVAIALVAPAMLLVMHVEVEIDVDERASFYDSVVERVDQSARGIGEWVDLVLNRTRQLLEEDGTLAALRDEHGAAGPSG